MDVPLTPEEQLRANWIAETREKIEAGWQECRRGELLDGEQVFERLRKQLEERAAKRSLRLDGSRDDEAAGR